MNQLIKPSNACFELISDDNLEGFRASPYLDDGGVATIGYGTIIYPNGVRVTLRDKPITKEQAMAYLEYHCNQDAKLIEPLIKVKLNQNQIDAILCFVYNFGVTKFKSSTLLKVINTNSNDFDKIEAQWRRWIYDLNIKTGKKEIKKGLVKRRATEFLLYSKPI